MKIMTKVAGLWKNAGNLYYKQAGAWKQIKAGYVKTGGVWKQFYAIYVPPPDPGSSDPPSVSLSAVPTHIVDVGTHLFLSSYATSSVGLRVFQFFIDGNLVGSSTVNPDGSSSYTASAEVQFLPQDNGTHYASVTVLDILGQAGYGGPIAITVNIPPPQTADTNPPSVTLTPSQTTVYDGNLSMSATSSDDVGVVRTELYKDGSMVASSQTAAITTQFTFTYADNGNHTFVAKAYDAAGNEGVSGTVNVNVAMAPPPSGWSVTYIPSDYNSGPDSGSASPNGIVDVYGGHVSSLYMYTNYDDTKINAWTWVLSFDGSAPAPNWSGSMTVSNNQTGDSVTLSKIDAYTWRYVEPRPTVANPYPMVRERYMFREGSGDTYSVG